MGYTTLIGVQPEVQPMIIRSTYRITRSHYTFGCPTYSSAYVCKLYVQNHLVTLHIYGSATLSAAYVGYHYVENHRDTLQFLVRHLKQNPCWLPLTFRFTVFYLTWVFIALGAAFYCLST